MARSMKEIQTGRNYNSLGVCSINDFHTIETHQFTASGASSPMTVVVVVVAVRS
jgi:hypothetical protein